MPYITSIVKKNQHLSMFLTGWRLTVTQSNHNTGSPISNKFSEKKNRNYDKTNIMIFH